MTVTNPAPCIDVSLMLIVAARKVLVVLLHCFLVRLAVTAFPVSKIRTARHAVGTLWLSGRHRFTSIKKALTECRSVPDESKDTAALQYKQASMGIALMIVIRVL